MPARMSGLDLAACAAQAVFLGHIDDKGELWDGSDENVRNRWRRVAQAAIEALPFYVKEVWWDLPLDLRQRWWAETAYGRKRPSAKLLGEIAIYRKPCS